MTQNTKKCLLLVLLVSVVRGLILEKRYEVCFGTNETVCYKWMSIEQGSTVVVQLET